MDKKISVLLVDDEADFTTPMAFWLESKGYAVEAAPEGKTAIKMIKKQPPDIIFLDLNMPVMNGPQTLKKIRRFNKELPVIIISAYLDDSSVNDLRPLGISGVFYKGADFQDGLALLESVLRTHKKLIKKK